MAASAHLVFGIMRAAERDMAISAEAIQEVVAWPEQITLPLGSSRMVRGLFDLRGQAVPIVALQGLAGSDATSEGCSHVAVLRTPMGRLGLAVDSIGGISRVAAEQVQALAGPSGGAETMLMRGLLRLSTHRTLPILDEAALAALPGLVFLAREASAREAGAREAGAREAGTSREQAQSPLSTYLVFTCDAFRFCVDASYVREIIDAPSIEATATRSDLYRGAAQLRGGEAAVVELHALLSLPVRGAARTKLVVLEQDGAVIGLAVSDIVAIQRCRPADLLGVPHYGPVRRDLVLGLLRGCAPEDPDAIVLSHDSILADREIAAIRRLHADISRESTQTAPRKAHLKFDAGVSFYAELSQFAEILAMPGQTLRLGPTDATYLGLLRRGTQAWPLIRLRALVDGTNTEIPASARVLLVRGTRGAFGFIVDAVQAIEPIAVRDELGSSDASGLLRNVAMCAATRKVWIDTPEGPRLRMIVDLNALAEELAGKACS